MDNIQSQTKFVVVLWLHYKPETNTTTLYMRHDLLITSYRAETNVENLLARIRMSWRQHHIRQSAERIKNIYLQPQDTTQGLPFATNTVNDCIISFSTPWQYNYRRLLLVFATVLYWCGFFSSHERILVFMLILIVTRIAFIHISFSATKTRPSVLISFSQNDQKAAHPPQKGSKNCSGSLLWAYTII